MFRAEELSETCRVLFQKLIWEISASGWFYYELVLLWEFITMHGHLNVKFGVQVFLKYQMCAWKQEGSISLELSHSSLDIIMKKHYQAIPFTSVSAMSINYKVYSVL